MAAAPIPPNSSSIPDDLLASAEILEQAIVDNVSTQSSSFSTVTVKKEEETDKNSDKCNLLFTFNGNELNETLDGRSLASLICPVIDYVFFDVDLNPNKRK